MWVFGCREFDCGSLTVGVWLWEFLCGVCLAVGVFVWVFGCGSSCVGVLVWVFGCGSLAVGVLVWVVPEGCVRYIIYIYVNYITNSTLIIYIFLMSHDVPSYGVFLARVDLERDKIFRVPWRGQSRVTGTERICVNPAAAISNRREETVFLFTQRTASS